MAFFEKRYHAPGTPPGTLSEVPATEQEEPRIRVIHYSQESISVEEGVDVDSCASLPLDQGITWLHVQGQPTQTIVRRIGDIFGLHALALEDVLNSGQRPKLETFDDQLFAILSLPVMEEDVVSVRQVSCFLSEHFMVSFCEGAHLPVELLIKRLNDKKSWLRTKGIDFLFYSLADIVVDQGFVVLESFGFQLEDLEDQILESTGTETLQNLHLIKRELILLRRMLWPQREVISDLMRNDFPLIQQDTDIYLRDCYDHTIQILDLLETYREMSGSMVDIYLSSVSNKMNETMRILTVIATIFIPLTFIVGVYGMNFDQSASAWNMPELRWPYGYLLIWGLMMLVAGVMVRFFRRRGWL